MNDKDYILRGDICYSETKNTLNCAENAFLVCIGGASAGVFRSLPERYRGLPLKDYAGKLIIPGLVDLHLHGPQFSLRSLGMDKELLDWLEALVFPEEAKYQDLGYAERAYALLVEDLRKGPNTRACLFATVHTPATLKLMDMLEASGLVCMVGKVNMDRNCPDSLRELNAEASETATREWLDRCGSYKRTKPILTPRFIPACTDDLLRRLSAVQKRYRLPAQSHLSENRREIAWVQELCPESAGYADAYARFGLLGGETPAVMAHCVWSDQREIDLLAERGVYAAHCPQSNANLSSGAASARGLLDAGVRVGLGSDVAGGAHTSIFRAMTDAVQVSKLRPLLTGQDSAPLTLEEVFYLGTMGGGSFFGAVGSFSAGYEFDALVIDDAPLAPPFALSLRERLERAVYLSDDRHIAAKYVRGAPVLDKSIE
jgi:guanine deaminase